ncbi:MAG: VIT1/CCC1 transporter family protein [Acidimicrobiales bacterium]
MANTRARPGTRRPPSRRVKPGPAARGTEPPLPEHHHRDVKGGAARAAVFGISDGLVSNVALILGVAGAATGPGPVRLAGLAGLVAGSCSMAAGEYVSMRAQRELFERELEIERTEIRRRPAAEQRELAHLYESRGLEPEMARDLAAVMMRDPETALDTHAREELGLDPSSLGSPIQAAASSFGSFALGAVLTLIPWFVTSGVTALVASIVIGVAAALSVGACLSLFTGRSWHYSAGRQLLLAAVAAGITYAVGTALGASGVA